MTDAIREGWHQVITVFPEARTLAAYRYESGGWWVPDPKFNEASLVGATITPLYTQAETADAWSKGYQAGERAGSSETVGTYHLNPYRP